MVEMHDPKKREILIKEIREKIIDSKKYNGLSEEFIENEIKKHLNSNPNLRRVTHKDIKEIKSKLHRVYSSYQTKKKRKLTNYIDELASVKDNLQLLNVVDSILSTTLSTKERINDYPNIYTEIFKLTGRPFSIVDLGCGLNPVSYTHMNLKKLNYYAYDISEQDIKFLNDYFKLMQKYELDGKAEILDVRNLSDISGIPNSDIVFLFKLIDLIDEKNKKTSEELIKSLINKTHAIVASFSTMTLTRKSMNLPQRRGFELMLERIGLQFKTISTHNEIFYIIYKN
jgi:16S rRNA (guanine(1405)-N(7))-methyltransferase